MLKEFKGRLAGRERRVLDRPSRAAVLVPIVDDGGPLRLILTRRTEGLPTHAGHVAFPGGHMAPGDDGPISTALREAHEEIALPAGYVEILGLLDDFPTITNTVAVTPVVGRLVEVPPLEREPGEVARIFDIPLELLAQPDRWRRQIFEREGRSHLVFFFDYEGETLWGLSARIVLHLMELMPMKAPFVLPAERLV